MAFYPCMCGARDCPECGPAQGFEVVRINGHWVNLEDDEDDNEKEKSEDESESEDPPA